MPISYTIDEMRGFIVETWSGDISIDDLASHWRNYLTNERVLAMRRTLVDMREAQIHFTAVELMDAVRQIAFPSLGGRDWISAMVVKSPEQYRTGTQYQVFAQTYSYDTIFSDIDTASTWLVKQQLRVP